MLVIGLVCSLGLTQLRRPDLYPSYNYDDPSCVQTSLRHFLACLAFVSAIAWLNLLANETVALLQALGLMLNISSSILGLTILAMGNSIGDLIADTAMARKSGPATAVASCFGSPLLNDVVGLGVSLTITCLRLFPEPFTFTLNLQVNVAWGFLASALVLSLFMFPVFKFQPPKLYGYSLMGLYVVFVVTTVFISQLE